MTFSAKENIPQQEDLSLTSQTCLSASLYPSVSPLIFLSVWRHNIFLRMVDDVISFMWISGSVGIQM